MGCLSPVLRYLDVSVWVVFARLVEELFCPVGMVPKIPSRYCMLLISPPDLNYQN